MLYFNVHHNALQCEEERRMNNIEERDIGERVIGGQLLMYTKKNYTNAISCYKSIYIHHNVL